MFTTKRLNSASVSGSKSKSYSFVYDKSGRMIYQWDQQTETITDYILLGKERVTEAQVSLGDGSQSVEKPTSAEPHDGWRFPAYTINTERLFALILSHSHHGQKLCHK
jgi:hypothetical protein